MARDKAWAAEFHQRMEEYDASRGIGRAAAAPLRLEAEPSSHDLYGIEERCRSEWASSPALRAEFTSLEAYTAFRRAETRGAVKIISRKN
jgi:hypothetical protein